MSAHDAALRVLLAPNPSPMTLDGTRTFVVGRERPVVIDPGPADPAHLRALRHALRNARPTAILLTHLHADHGAAAAPLARATGAPVWLARGALDLPPGLPVDRWAADGDTVDTDAGEVRVVATPGHTPEHLAFWWPDRRALFVGDLLLGRGDTTLVAPPEGDLSAYLRSLERVAELDPAILYPAHGPPLADPPQTLARYRAHRDTRIEQVRRALREAPDESPEALVHRIYGPDLPAALLDAAAGSVRAVVDFLRVRGTD